MNKTELVKNVAGQIDGATQKDVAVLVDIVLETIVNTVASGEKVSLASKSPKFHALTGFKNAVKNA